VAKQKKLRFSANLNLAKALPQNPHGAIARCYALPFYSYLH